MSEDRNRALGFFLVPVAAFGIPAILGGVSDAMARPPAEQAAKNAADRARLYKQGALALAATSIVSFLVARSRTGGRGTSSIAEGAAVGSAVGAVLSYAASLRVPAAGPPPIGGYEDRRPRPPFSTNPTYAIREGDTAVVALRGVTNLAGVPPEALQRWRGPQGEGYALMTVEHIERKFPDRPTQTGLSPLLPISRLTGSVFAYFEDARTRSTPTLVTPPVRVTVPIEVVASAGDGGVITYLPRPQTRARPQIGDYVWVSTMTLPESTRTALGTRVRIRVTGVGDGAVAGRVDPPPPPMFGAEGAITVPLADVLGDVAPPAQLPAPAPAFRSNLASERVRVFR